MAYATLIDKVNIAEGHIKDKRNDMISKLDKATSDL